MMADLVLRAENVGVRPMFEHVERSRRRAHQTPGSFRQRRQVDDREIRTFVLSWQGGTDGQRFLLQKARDDSLGGVLLMDFTPLGEIDANKVEVQLVAGSMSIVRTGLNTWNMRAEFEEAHA